MLQRFIKLGAVSLVVIAAVQLACFLAPSALRVKQSNNLRKINFLRKPALVLVITRIRVK